MYFVHRFTKFDKKKHLTIEKNSVYYKESTKEDSADWIQDERIKNIEEILWICNLRDLMLLEFFSYTFYNIGKGKKIKK